MDAEKNLNQAAGAYPGTTPSNMIHQSIMRCLGLMLLSTLLPAADRVEPMQLEARFLTSRVSSSVNPSPTLGWHLCPWRCEVEWEIEAPPGLRLIGWEPLSRFVPN